MEEFMEKANEYNLKIDFVTMHWYSSPNAKRFLKKINDTYIKYKKPIWITEFAVADWKGENRFTEHQVLDFMKKVLPELEKMPFVERYAWKSTLQSDKYLKASALFDVEGRLTSLGKYYAAFGTKNSVRKHTTTKKIPNYYTAQDNSSHVNLGTPIQVTNTSTTGGSNLNTQNNSDSSSNNGSLVHAAGLYGGHSGGYNPNSSSSSKSFATGLRPPK